MSEEMSAKLVNKFYLSVKYIKVEIFLLKAKAEYFSGACFRLVSADWWTIACQPISRHKTPQAP